MNVFQELEALVKDLQQRVKNGDESCRLLLRKADEELHKVREKGSSSHALS